MNTGVTEDELDKQCARDIRRLTRGDPRVSPEVRKLMKALWWSGLLHMSAIAKNMLDNIGAQE
jgi:hypothetical protein